MRNLQRDIATSCDVRRAYEYDAAITTEAGGDIIDTQGFGSVAILGRITAVAGTAATYQLKQGDASNMSDATTSFWGNARAAASTSAKTFLLDVPRVEKRYVQLFITGVGGAAGAFAMASLYNAGNEPITQSALKVIYV